MDKRALRKDAAMWEVRRPREAWGLVGHASTLGLHRQLPEGSFCPPRFSVHRSTLGAPPQVFKQMDVNDSGVLTTDNLAFILSGGEVDSVNDVCGLGRAGKPCSDSSGPLR